MDPLTRHYGHTGDGVKMAMEVGAAFADSDLNYMVFPMANGVDWSIEAMVGSSGNALLRRGG